MLREGREVGFCANSLRSASRDALISIECMCEDS